MEILLLWILFGFIGMAIGVKKGMSQAKAFIAGILIGPFSLLMFFVSDEKRKCPHCSAMIPLDASVCRYCRGDVIPVTGSGSNVECPYCKSLIKSDDASCRFCGKAIA